MAYPNPPPPPQFPTTNPNPPPPPPPQFPTTNPNPPPLPQFPTAMSQSLQFPRQFSSQHHFHFPTSQSPAPYPVNRFPTLPNNLAVTGYGQTRRPSQGGLFQPNYSYVHGMPRHPLLHPAVTGIQGSTVPTVLRAAFVPNITPKEERKIIVYVGSLATTVEDDFILSLLEVCGPVKNWKRSEDPTTGTPNHYGFCEFESVVGVLRALRLLSKLNVDGQELKIRVTADERKYLADFVEKLKGTEGEGAKKDEDREADQKALERLTGMIEERLKNTPVLPPPSLLPAHASGLREEPARSRDVDSDMDMTRNAEDKNDDEMTSDSKPTSEHDKPETSSTDRSRGQERSKKGGKKEKEKQLEGYEIERMQDMYEARANRRRKLQKKEWECRERQKEYLQRLEKVRNKEKEYKRKWKIKEQEDDIDGSDLKRREHKSREERRKLEKKVSEYTQRRKYLQKLKKEEKKEEKYRRKPEGMKQEDDIDGGDLKRGKHKSSGSKERRRKLREKEEDSEDRLKEEKVAEKSDAGKDRSTHSHDRSSRRVRGRNDNETNRTRDEGRKDNYARSGVRERI